MSSGQPSGTHTQVGFGVDDVEAEVADLKAKGVTFEEYDFPGLKTVDGVAEIEGERAAWFKDCEGNLLSISTETG
jgi:predicted enzyme related to lactoylglutathione lyase